MDIIKEADKAFKEGKAQVKTGVFKWSKDYNSAVTYFDEAGEIKLHIWLYRQAKEWKKSLEALEQCKICNEKLNEIWGTARNIEAMVNILIENVESKEFEKIHALTLEVKEQIQFEFNASMLFKGVDSHTESIKLKQKAAKYLIKNQVIDQAIELLESGIQDADESEKMYNKKEIFDYYLEVLVELNQYSKAITMIKKQFTNPTDSKNKFQSPSYGLCIVILSLLCDEILRAESEFNSLCQTQIYFICKNIIPGFYSAREYEVSEALMNAYKEGNQEEFTNQAQKPSVTNLYPPNIPRILKKKKLKIVNKKPQQQQSNNKQLSDDQANLFGQQKQNQDNFDDQQKHNEVDADDLNAVL